MHSSNPIDKDLADWNDRMYASHPTPYKNGFAGHIQNRRVSAVFRLAEAKPGERILELGCESGHLLLQAPSGVKITGADISVKALEDAEALFKSRNRQAVWTQVDAMEPLPFNPGDFDVIICSEMLEHVKSPELVFEQIAKICTSSTRIVVTVPIEAPKVAIKSILSKIGLLGVFFPNIEEGQSEWHLQSFSKSMLKDLAEKKFRILEIHNVWGCHLVASLRLKAPAS